MCKAWDDQKAEGIKEGIARGRAESQKEIAAKTYIEAYMEFGINDKATILTKLRQKFKDLSESEAESYISMYPLT